MSGKSFWTFRLLREKENMFSFPPEKVLYCYGIYQPLFEQMEKEMPFVSFHQGLPDEDVLQHLASPASWYCSRISGLITSDRLDPEMAM